MFRTMLRMLPVVWIILIATSAKAKKPEWVTNYGRSASYPETQFLTGFGACLGIGTETKEIAQDNARADLYRSIIVNKASFLR